MVRSKSTINLNVVQCTTGRCSRISHELGCKRLVASRIYYNSRLNMQWTPELPDKRIARLTFVYLSCQCDGCTELNKKGITLLQQWKEVKELSTSTWFNALPKDVQGYLMNTVVKDLL